MSQLTMDDKVAIFEFVADSCDEMDMLVSQVNHLPIGDVPQVLISYHALQIKMVMVTLSETIKKQDNNH